jgi:hypothetical protein
MNTFRKAVFTNIEIEPKIKTVMINHFSSGSQGVKKGSAYDPMLFLISDDISMNVITIMNSSMNNIIPPGGVGGGADCPLMA